MKAAFTTETQRTQSGHRGLKTLCASSVCSVSAVVNLNLLLTQVQTNPLLLFLMPFEFLLAAGLAEGLFGGEGGGDRGSVGAGLGVVGSDVLG
jgi:hypothetical protein